MFFFLVWQGFTTSTTTTRTTSGSPTGTVSGSSDQETVRQTTSGQQDVGVMSGGKVPSSKTEDVVSGQPCEPSKPGKPDAEKPSSEVPRTPQPVATEDIEVERPGVPGTGRPDPKVGYDFHTLA